jgi:hypothetical protein
MSDDTPTERFDPRRRDGENPPAEEAGTDAPANNEDTPTQLFDTRAASREQARDGAADAVGPEDAEIQDPAAPVGDAPTERFAAPAGDAPTERFAAADPVVPAPVPPSRGGYSGPIDTYNPDAPTERFDPTNGGAWPPVDQQPTRVMPAASAPRAQSTTRTTTTTGNPPPEKKSRALLWWLIGIGAALVIAVIVLLVLLFGGDEEQAPAASPSPTASVEPVPEPEPSETEAPPEPEPTATTPPVATGPTFATFSAPSSGQCEEGEDNAPLSFSWSSDNAVRAYLGVGTQNAALNPTVSDLPPTATYDELEFECSVASQVYTVTLEDELGTLASRTVTVTR